MSEKQFKRELHELIINITGTMGLFATNLELSDENLAKTQKLVKKFDQTLTELIDSRKLKCEVGDYVVEQNGNIIFKIDRVSTEGRLFGRFYKRDVNHFAVTGCFLKDTERFATPEEITEYNVALNFYKHGRESFDVRAGDVVEKSDGDRVFVAYKNSLTKEDFISGKFVLVGTKEEFNEWMENK